MFKKIGVVCALIFALTITAGIFENSKADQSNFAGIHVKLFGTGQNNATVIGTCGGNTYVFTQVPGTNEYNLTSGYPVDETMQICVCTTSSTGASTTITTDYSYDLKLNLSNGCPTGCPGS